MLPKGFALGAAKGNGNFFNRAKVIGWFGTRTATVSFPAVIISGIVLLFFKT